MRLAVLMPLSLCLIACGDPIIGQWEAEYENADYDLTFLEDGLGEAKVGFAGGTGRLTFDLEWERSDDLYTIDLECKSSDVDGFPCEAYDGLTKLDCEMEGDVLSCDLDDCSECDDIEFAKQE